MDSQTLTAMNTDDLLDEYARRYRQAKAPQNALGLYWWARVSEVGEILTARGIVLELVRKEIAAGVL